MSFLAKLDNVSKYYDNIIVISHCRDELVFFYDFITHRTLLILITNPSSERELYIINELVIKKGCELIILDNINSFDITKKDEYKHKMHLWFKKTLEENQSINTIVMGHIPIFYYSHIKNKEKKEKKEEKKEKEKKEKPPVGSRYTDFIDFYKLMTQHNVSTYMCADEHNMQVLQDLKHGINHIICGSSPGGGGSDEAYNLDETNLYFNNKMIIVPELEENFNKKIIINAPSFTNLILHESLLQFNIVSGSNLVNHHKVEYCATRVCTQMNPSAQIYDIITIPKYRDIIGVYNCDEFNANFCT